MPEEPDTSPTPRPNTPSSTSSSSDGDAGDAPSSGRARRARSHPSADRGGVPWGSVLRNAFLVLTILVMIWLALNVRLPSLEELREDFASLGAWGPLAFIGAYAVVALTPIPVTIMAVVAGMLFGLPAGTVLSMIGVVIGCWGAYWVARGLGRETVMRALGSHAGMIEDRLENGGFYAVCTVRLMPGIPYWPVNYGSGALGVPSRDFLVATTISALPGQISLIAIGAFLGSPTFLNGSVVVASWIAVIILTVLSYRRWRTSRSGTEAESPEGE